MIARLWRGWATPEGADLYDAHYRTEVSDALAGVPGFVGARLLRRDAGGEVELVSLTFFEDMASVRAFAGPDHETAVVAEPARRVLTRFDDTVVHYEVPYAT